MSQPLRGTRREFLAQGLAIGAMGVGSIGTAAASEGAELRDPQVTPWKMIEPGAGGAFFAVGAGPTGIVVVAADLSGPYISYDAGKSWSNRGPAEGIQFGSHACAVGFDPSDERIIYVGTNGVLYRSDDRGRTFGPYVPVDWGAASRSGGFRLSGPLPEPQRSPLWGSELYWTAITFFASDPRVGYAAAHSTYNSVDAMVFRTKDRGATWNVVCAFPPDQRVRIQKILVDPRDSAVLYALSQPDKFSRPNDPATDLRKSEDGGVTWRVLQGEGGALQQNVLDFEIDPVDPHVLYATQGGRGGRADAPTSGFYRSVDAGAHWSRLDARFGAIKTALERGPGRPRTVLRLFEYIGWESTPRIAERKYPRAWESRDGGHTWRYQAGPANFKFGAIDPGFYGSASAYCKTIAAAPAAADLLYWVDSQWVYRSDDGGTSFRSAGSDVLIRPDGQKWYRTTGVSNVVSLTLQVSEAEPGLLLGGCADIGLWRSLDTGDSWQHANEPGFLSDWIYYGGQAQALALDPERPNVMWAGLGAGYVDQVMIKSEASGKLGSWRRSHSGLPLEKRRASYQPGSALRGLSVDRTSPRDRRVLYVVADDQVCRSRDDGATWTPVCDLTAGHPFDYHASKRGKNNYDRQGATAVDPSDGRYVYAGGTDGFYWSARSGENGSWMPIGNPSLRRIQKIVVSRANPRRIYVAAYGTGLWRSEDRGLTWELILKDRFLRGLAVHPQNDRILFAAASNAFSSGGRPESRGLCLSVDDGRTWRQVNAGLSWPFVRDVEFNPKDPAQVFIVTPGTSYHVGRFRFA